MILRYKNFIIEYDRNSFILKELWIVWETNPLTWEATKNAGLEKVIDECYPPTLERCIEKIAHKLKRDKKAVIELTNISKELTEINSNFIKDIKETLQPLNEVIKEDLW